MYELYLGTTLFPIAPSKMQIKIKSQNKTMNLMNDGEITILKDAGLTEISFDLLLPNVPYPFAKYKSRFQNAKHFLDILEYRKVRKKPVQFKLIRTFPNGKMLFDTDMKVSIEDYTIKEDAKQGFDVVVSVKLKQYREYGTKTCKIVNDDNEVSVSVEETRETDNSPKPTVIRYYTTSEGDSLWNISKLYYGDGTKMTHIYVANRDLVNDPHYIKAGVVLTIPVLE